MVNTSIFANNQSFDIGSRVVLWSEDDGLSFYKKAMKYAARDDSYETLRDTLNCFVFHHAVSYTAKTTYTGLVGRGLSVNFIIDDDNVNGAATIYQCLDIKDAGYSHKPLNMLGAGVEIAYQPTAWLTPNAYSDLNISKMDIQPHKIVDDTVHGVTHKVFAPTAAQVAACINLLWGYASLFPNVRQNFPRDDKGSVIKTWVKDTQGFLAHFHITGDKVDPYGFPFDYVEKQVKNRLAAGF